MTTHNNLNFFITNQQIPQNKKLKYLITIPCVNRMERNAINVIDKTFEEFEKSNMFDSNINENISFDIMLFESGSRDTSYLNFIQGYKQKVNISVLYSNSPLNGVSNTLRMFLYIKQLPENYYDFIIWMDDDVFVCQNFMKNADTWIKNYANFSIFSSLYVPYNSTFVYSKKYLNLAHLTDFIGTCCTIFKPQLAQHIIPNWYNPHFEQFKYNPDTRFRDSVRRKFPTVKKICVSFPSIVEHMNIGSSIYMNKNINKGHKAKNYVGSHHDPQYYIKDVPK